MQLDNGRAYWERTSCLLDKLDFTDWLGSLPLFLQLSLSHWFTQNYTFFKHKISFSTLVKLLHTRFTKILWALSLFFDKEQHFIIKKHVWTLHKTTLKKFRTFKWRTERKYFLKVWLCNSTWIGPFCKASLVNAQYQTVLRGNKSTAPLLSSMDLIHDYL
jgi:hypothetical protein